MEEITITGIIAPIEWNNDGSITGIMIADAEENEYALENNRVAISLIGRLRLGRIRLGRILRKVSVYGHLGIDDNGTPTIEALRFKILEDEKQPSPDVRILP